MGNQTWNEANSLFWIKHYRDKVTAFESGEIYVQMRKEHREELAFQDRIIRGLKTELVKARAENGRIVRYPYRYLTWVMKTAPKLREQNLFEEQLSSLLPMHAPAECRTFKKTTDTTANS